MSSMAVIKRLLTHSVFWDNVQLVFGATRFKKELYLSKLHPPGRLLDFGCANGHIADAFLKFDYQGVDIDPVAIEAAKRRFRNQPNMHFMAADFSTRHFPADEFDEILFACTIHHVDDDTLLRLLKELHYCLKPDGVIHIFDLVRQETDGWSQKLMRWLDQGRYTRNLPQIFSLIDSVGLFQRGEHSLHTPYGRFSKIATFSMYLWENFELVPIFGPGLWLCSERSLCPGCSSPFASWGLY